MTFSCIKFKKKFKMKFNLTSGCANSSTSSTNDGAIKEPNASHSSRSSSASSSYKSYSNHSNIELNNSKTGLCKNAKGQTGSKSAIKSDSAKKIDRNKETPRKHLHKLSKRSRKDKRESKKNKFQFNAQSLQPPPNPPSIDSIPSLPSSFLATSVITSNSLLTTGTSSYSANSSALLMKHKSSRSNSSAISEPKAKPDSKMEKLEKLKDAKYQKDKKKKEKFIKQEIYEKINPNAKLNDHLYCPLDFSNNGRIEEKTIKTPKFEKLKSKQSDNSNTISTTNEPNKEKKKMNGKILQNFDLNRDLKQDEYNYALSQKSTSSASKSKSDENLEYRDDQIVPGNEVYDEYIDNTSQNNSEDYEYEEDEEQNNQISCQDCKKECDNSKEDEYEKEYVYEYEYEERNETSSEMENYDEKNVQIENIKELVENEYDAVDSCEDDLAAGRRNKKDNEEKNFGLNYFKLIDDDTYLDLNEITISCRELVDGVKNKIKREENIDVKANELSIQNDVENLETEGEQEIEFHSENSDSEASKSMNQNFNCQNEYELKFDKYRNSNDLTATENSVTCTSF